MTARCKIRVKSKKNKRDVEEKTTITEKTVEEWLRRQNQGKRDMVGKKHICERMVKRKDKEKGKERHRREENCYVR